MEINNDDNESKISVKQNFLSTNTPESKKVKPLFITLNRFSLLSNNDTEMSNIRNNLTINENLLPVLKANFQTQFLSVEY